MTLVSASPALAGMYMEHEVVAPDPANPTQSIRRTVRSWFEHRRMKRESPLRGETIIVDLEKREVFGVHEEHKTWWKMPTERYQQLAAGALFMMGVRLGPDGTPQAPKPMFVETKQESVIAGRKARELRVAAPAAPGVTMSLWVTKDLDISPAALERHVRMSMGDPQGAGFDDIFRAWSTLDGYPVQNVTTVKTPTGTLMTSETLLVVRKEEIPASIFVIPAAFSRIDDPLTLLERSVPSAPPPSVPSPVVQSQSAPAQAPY